MKPGAQLCRSNSDNINLVLVVDAKLGGVQGDGNSTGWMAPGTVPYPSFSSRFGCPQLLFISTTAKVGDGFEMEKGKKKKEKNQPNQRQKKRTTQKNTVDKGKKNCSIESINASSSELPCKLCLQLA